MAVGALAVFAGFSTGGILGMASRQFGNNVDLVQRIFASLPGLAIVWIGLFSIMQSQGTKASLDSAEMSRESLRLARAESGFRPSGNGQVRQEPIVSRGGEHSAGAYSKQPGDRIKVFKGRDILKSETGVSVDGRHFENVLQAEKWISSQ